LYPLAGECEVGAENKALRVTAALASARELLELDDWLSRAISVSSDSMHSGDTGVGVELPGRRA